MSDVKRYNSNAGIGQKVTPVGGNSHTGSAPTKVAPVSGNKPAGAPSRVNAPTGGNIVPGAEVHVRIGGKG